MSSEITFYQDIKPLFREKDRTCMKASFDLYNYEAVCEKADVIHDSLIGNKVPQMPPGDGKWSQENINKFKQWIATGKKMGLPPEREAFYKLLNNESFSDFLPTAKEMAYTYLKNAESVIAKPPPELGRYGKLFQHFTFTQEAFNERLQQIYDYIKEEVDKYQPANDHFYHSREDVIERVRQWAPFNQTDGAWLRYAVELGPTNEIQSLLSEIYQDELGNGQVELNHSTLYTTLLASCGIYLPEVYQRTYAEDPKFLDSAFSSPALSLCISQFSKLFFPEILGFTLLIEWTVLESIPIIKLFKYYGVDPHFYEMHVAIDNASSGHGAKAKLAIELYLDHVRQNGGDGAVQEHWKRIWTGFVALWSTGTLAKDIKNKLYRKRIGSHEFPLRILTYDHTLSHKDFNVDKSHLGQPDLRERMIKMIADKASYASRNHNNRKLGGVSINKMFNNPEGFLNALAESSYVVKGDPEKSPILARLTTWDGPMYKIFTEEELNLWNDWILSLDQNIPPPNQIKPFDIFTEMTRLIKTLKNNQNDTPGHSHVLTGPDPDKPDDRASFVTKSIHWWLEHDPIWVMKALICEKNEYRMVIPKKPEESPFITRMMSPANKMGSAFADIAISRGPMKIDNLPITDKPSNLPPIIIEPWSWKDIAYRWIQLGCPLESSDFVERSVNIQPLYGNHTGVISHHVHGPGGIH